MANGMTELADIVQKWYFFFPLEKSPTHFLFFFFLKIYDSWKLFSQIVDGRVTEEVTHGQTYKMALPRSRLL